MWHTWIKGRQVEQPGRSRDPAVIALQPTADVQHAALGGAAVGGGVEVGVCPSIVLAERVAVGPQNYVPVWGKVQKISLLLLLLLLFIAVAVVPPVSPNTLHSTYPISSPSRRLPWGEMCVGGRITYTLNMYIFLNYLN